MKQHEQACSFCGRQGCVSKGLCATCYQRQRRYGTPLYYRDRKPKPTNADRIRSMSDEELAMFLQDIFYISGSNDTSHGWWLDWLKQEAADG